MVWALCNEAIVFWEQSLQIHDRLLAGVQGILQSGLPDGVINIVQELGILEDCLKRRDLDEYDAQVMWRISDRPDVVPADVDYTVGELHEGDDSRAENESFSHVRWPP